MTGRKRAGKGENAVKRLLRDHKYPPEGQEEAVIVVIVQCEMWTENADYFVKKRQSVLETLLPK